MNKLEIKITFNEFAAAKNTPVLTVTNVQSGEDLEIVKAVLDALKNVKQ